MRARATSLRAAFQRAAALSIAIGIASSTAGAANAQQLAPPPPMGPGGPVSPADPNAAPSGLATTQRLDEAEREDSGRGFELFWADAHVGASYIDMGMLSSDALQLDKASAAGPLMSLGAGVRFVTFVLGVRAKYNLMSAFDLWQLNAEAGLKLPLGKLDVFAGAHGGYSFVGSLAEGAVTSNGALAPNVDAVKVRGINAGIDAGVDYYVLPKLSIGGGVLADFLFLSRSQVDAPAGLSPAAQAAVAVDPLYQKSGSGVGMQFGALFRIGLHLGL